MVSTQKPTLKPNSLPNNNQRTRSRGIVIAAFTLFALSGLLIGFAVGAFTRARQPGQPQIDNTGSTTTAIQAKTPQTTSTTVHAVPLGWPVVDKESTVEATDGTSYTFTAHAVDRSIDGKAHGKAVHASGITCKLWLTKAEAYLTAKELQPNYIQNPIGGEIPGSLIFSSATSQTQPCDNGQGSWTYQVSPTVKPGSYYLTVLTYWDNVHYNWYWSLITIVKKAN